MLNHTQKELEMLEYQEEEIEARGRLMIAQKTLRVIKNGAECRGLLFSDYDISGHSIQALHNEVSAISEEYNSIEAYYANKISLGNNNVELEQALALLYELFYYNNKSCKIEAEDAIATIELVIHMLGYILLEYDEIGVRTEISINKTQ